LKGDLSLLRTGLNDLDLRKPVSVEKKDVIQHANGSENDEVPEMLRDKNVKIIKQTKNEIIQKIARKVEVSEVGEDKDLEKDSSSSDSDFERLSNDDTNDKEQNNILAKEVRNNYETIDKDGVKWTTLHDNMDSSWIPLPKFDRWIVVDAPRH
jgi:hypothetical protein